MDAQIEIYPNPTANSFNIACTIPEELINDFEVNIFDLNGKILLQTKTTQHADIDVSTLPQTFILLQLAIHRNVF
ncbi:MAG: T9SS type A sorting domain-containing protein [Bacteroidetes bacterium]|nr:T9SS type A sorting domain-containing protein [Bacteroidota bacterium]